MGQTQPNPAVIFRKLTAYQETAALKGAIELGLFSAIGRGEDTPAKLAVALGVAERGARILSDFLVVGGLLEKSGERYRLTPEAALFLDEASPTCIASAALFLCHPESVKAYADVAGSVRRGGTILENQGNLAPETPLWVEFARGMAPLMRPAAEAIAALMVPDAAPATPMRVLDVAAGHGLFGIAIARRNPQARVRALDWPAVLQVAKENAERAGIADRFELLPGDALRRDLGDGHDVVLLTNLLHHFDEPTCVALMRRCRTALVPGGRLVVLEFVPNEDRVSPPDAGGFSFIMLNSTPSGDAYPYSRFEVMFREAGFSGCERHPSEGLHQTILTGTAQ